MFMEAFHIWVPEIGYDEYRHATIRGGYGLPNGAYGFSELYCVDPNCDCRRATIAVFSPELGPRQLATLSYGWEDVEFYRKWAPHTPDPDELSGVCLSLLAPQSEYSQALLALFEEMVEDQEYADRIVRHYALVKEAIAARQSLLKGSQADRKPSKGSKGKKKRRKKR